MMLNRIINFSKNTTSPLSSIKSSGSLLYFKNNYTKISSTKLNGNNNNLNINPKFLNIVNENGNKTTITNSFNNTFTQKNQYLKRIYSTNTTTSQSTATSVEAATATATTINNETIETKVNEEINNNTESTTTTTTTTTKSTKPPPKGFMKFIRGPYMTLIKLPITVYVTLTAIAGYVAACPVGSFDWIVLSQVTVGTFLASCSANIHNQEMEVQHDRKMPRTKDRPLVVGSINRGKAWAGSMALLTLGFGTMAITPALFVPGTLAACNVILYCWYTDLKRVTPLNTWVGAIVGAIPPLIGSVAATGHFEAVGMLMATFLYIWQIPHFLALSQVLREQYRGAGYKMLSVTHSKQTVDRVSLAHALFGIPLPYIFDYLFNFNVHPITLACMSLSCVSLALPFFTKITPKRLYIISLISLPLTLFLSCFFRQPYTYYSDDDDDKKDDKETASIETKQQIKN